MRAYQLSFFFWWDIIVDPIPKDMTWLSPHSLVGLNPRPRHCGTKQGLYHWAITLGYTNMLNIPNILSKSIPNDALFTNIHHLQHIDLIIPFATHLVKKWTIRSNRTFNSGHLDQSLWLANQKKSFPFSAALLVHTTPGIDNVEKTISHNFTSYTSPKIQCTMDLMLCLEML